MSRSLVPPKPASPEEGGLSAGQSFAVSATAERRLGEFGFALVWALAALLQAFPPSGEQFYPWLMIPMSALISLHFLGRSLDPRPRLVIDEGGIVDHTSIAGGDLHIPWAEVLSVSTSGLRGGVELTLRDPKALKAKAGWRRRVDLWLATLVGRRTVSINTTLLGVNRVELKSRIEDALLQFERRALGFDGDSHSAALPHPE